MRTAALRFVHLLTLMPETTEVVDQRVFRRLVLVGKNTFENALLPNLASNRGGVNPARVGKLGGGMPSTLPNNGVQLGQAASRKHLFEVLLGLQRGERGSFNHTAGKPGYGNEKARGNSTRSWI